MSGGCPPIQAAERRVACNSTPGPRTTPGNANTIQAASAYFGTHAFHEIVLGPRTETWFLDRESAPRSVWRQLQSCRAAPRVGHNYSGIRGLRHTECHTPRAFQMSQMSPDVTVSHFFWPVPLAAGRIAEATSATSPGRADIPSGHLCRTARSALRDVGGASRARRFNVAACRRDTVGEKFLEMAVETNDHVRPGRCSLSRVSLRYRQIVLRRL
jgi:hypothetical protein